MFRFQEVTLDMPRISGTQFRPPYDDHRQCRRLAGYLDVYKALHAAGKKTWYAPVDEQDMRDAILEGDPRHLLLYISAASRDEAQRMIDTACACTQRRLQELGL